MEQGVMTAVKIEPGVKLVCLESCRQELSLLCRHGPGFWSALDKRAALLPRKHSARSVVRRTW